MQLTNYIESYLSAAAAKSGGITARDFVSVLLAVVEVFQRLFISFDLRDTCLGLNSFSVTSRLSQAEIFANKLEELWHQFRTSIHHKKFQPNLPPITLESVIVVEVDNLPKGPYSSGTCHANSRANYLTESGGLPYRPVYRGDGRFYNPANHNLMENCISNAYQKCAKSPGCYEFVARVDAWGRRCVVSKNTGSGCTKSSTTRAFRLLRATDIGLQSEH